MRMNIPALPHPVTLFLFYFSDLKCAVHVALVFSYLMNDDTEFSLYSCYPFLCLFWKSRCPCVFSVSNQMFWLCFKVVGEIGNVLILNHNR